MHQQASHQHSHAKLERQQAIFEHAVQIVVRNVRFTRGYGGLALGLDVTDTQRRPARQSGQGSRLWMRALRQHIGDTRVERYFFHPISTGVQQHAAHR